VVEVGCECECECECARPRDRTTTLLQLCCFPIPIRGLELDFLKEELEFLLKELEFLVEQGTGGRVSFEGTGGR
jgi:hypothetical protein